MIDRMRKQTRAAAVTAQMREDILDGRLRPGERLMFPELSRRYEASVGVTREALAALAAQGLVRAQAHQGYVVSPLSRENLSELTAARLMIEPPILRQALVDGDLEWESRVVAAHHRLARTPRGDGGYTTSEWASAHAAFHAALFSGCGNSRLRQLARSLGEEASLYRRWSAPLERDRDVAAEHAGLLEAALARDGDLAAERLCAHIGLTARLLLEHAQELTVAISL
jgi:DNA-binding GntR family transcriptional regulator